MNSMSVKQMIDQVLDGTLIDHMQTSVTSVTCNGGMHAITVFILACFVGYYVVWKVTPALHAPLMSVTNAISSVVIIGGLIAASQSVFAISKTCGFIAVFLASINIFGGFLITARMLKMFRKK